MALQIRRGTDAQRQTIAFKSGELIYTTDLKDIYVGDGVTNGGTQLSPVKSVNGSTGTVVLTTDQVTQGSTNKYYSATQAKIDSGAALVAGNAGNTGITFSYNGSTNVINAVVTNVGGLSTVGGDPNPALGGNLSLNSRNIIGTGLINITGNITASGSIGNGNVSLTTNVVSSTTGTLSIGSTSATTGLAVTSSLTDGILDVKGLAGATMRVFASNGTLASPTALLANDSPGGIKFKAYNANGLYNTVAGIFCQYNAPASDLNNTDSLARGTIAFTAGYGTTPIFASFNSYGVFTAPVFQLASYANDAARTTAIPTPGPGMMVFMTSGTSPAVTNKAVIYNGSAWAVLPG